MSENIDELKKIIFELTVENVNLKEKMKRQDRSNVLFHEYLCKWLEEHKNKVKMNSFLSYKSIVYKHIVPYFRKRQLTLNQLTPQILEEYYRFKLDEKLSANTIGKHHANIHSALKSAVRNGYITTNVADYVDKPKISRYKANFLTASEMNEILSLFEKHRMYIPILLSASLGLRRSEVLGLKWDAIDFNKKNNFYKAYCSKNIGKP